MHLPRCLAWTCLSHQALSQWLFRCWLLLQWCLGETSSDFFLIPAIVHIVNGTHFQGDQTMQMVILKDFASHSALFGLVLGVNWSIPEPLICLLAPYQWPKKILFGRYYKIGIYPGINDHSWAFIVNIEQQGSDILVTIRQQKANMFQRVMIYIYTYIGNIIYTCISTHISSKMIIFGIHSSKQISFQSLFCFGIFPGTPPIPWFLEIPTRDELISLKEIFTLVVWSGSFGGWKTTQWF